MFRVIEENTSEPVSVADAKLYARIAYDVEDTLVAQWIKSGRELAEKYQRRSYLEQTVEYSCDGGYPSFPLSLPRSDYCRLIDRVTIYDTDSSATVLYNSATEPITDGGYLDFNLHANPSKIDVKYAATLPTVTLRNTRSFVVQYYTGYDSSASVPAYIRDAICLYCAYRNENRTGENPVPESFYNLLSRGRIYA